MTPGRLGLAGVAVFVVLLGVTGLSRGYRINGDTGALVRGTRAALDCVDSGRWTRCGTAPGSFDSRVGPFPLLQYLPAVVMVKLGWSDARIVWGLSILNFAAFVILLTLIGAAGRRLRSPTWTPLLLVITLSSPLLFYATSAFGEMLSATLVLACLVAVLYRRPLLIFVLAAMAGIGKETLPVFVVLLGSVAGRDDAGDGWLAPVRVLAPLLGGAVTAVVAGSLFNMFRWGGWANRNYLRPEFRLERARTARNLWNLLVAPGGGLGWFWPSLCILLAGLTIVVVCDFGRHRNLDPRSMAVPSLVVLSTMAGLLVGLASWWSPFGWVAWGPRLTLPVLPALAVAAVHAGGRPLAQAAQGALRRWWGLAPLVLVVTCSAWPQAGAPWQADRVARVLLVKDRACPEHLLPFSRPYYDCADHVAWRRHPNQLMEAVSGGGPAGVAGQVVLVTSVVALLGEARRRAASRPQRG